MAAGYYFSQMKSCFKHIILTMILLASCRSSNMIEIERRESETEEVFQEFWDFFENNYAYFSLREVSWKGMYSRYLHFVHDGTSDKQLWHTMTKMIDPLEDAQVILEDRSRDGQFFNSASPTGFKKEFPTDSLREAMHNLSTQTLQANSFQPLKKPEVGGLGLRSPKMFLYSTSPDFGYLKIKRFAGAGRGRTQRQLHEIMLAMAPKKGMLIDLREAYGDDEKLLDIVAGHFTDQNQLGYLKQYRKEGSHETFTNLKSWNLKPKGKIQFTKPIILITNEETSGSAEIFTMVLSQLAHTQVIGTRTRGTLSTPLVNHLPNGWYVSLSNERIFSSDTICYEEIGVPVDFKIRNKREDLASGEDPVLKHALGVLSDQAKGGK